jgi:hypothetical protein
MAEVVACTGADQGYFLMSCLLMRALKDRAQRLSFGVLDFGLTDRQRRFLSRHTTLLDRPPQMAAGLDPWFYKAAIGRYLAPLEWSAAVWLDGDMIPVGPLDAGIDRLLANMRNSRHGIAACRDAVGSAESLAKTLDVGPFVDRLRADGVPLDAPYFNSGVFVCTSPEFLRQWDAVVQTMPVHPVFEQNGFNIVLHRSREPMELPGEVWNLHGPNLAEAAVSSGGEVRLAGHDPALVVHLTSHRPQDVLTRSEIKIGRQRIGTYVRWFGNPALRGLQLSTLGQFLLESWDELQQFGLVGDAVGVRPAPAAGVAQDAAFRHALTLQAHDEWADADASLARLEQIHPANAEVICQRAHGYWRQDMPAAAAEFAERALQSDPKHIRANMILGLARARLGASREAIESFDRVIAADPQSADAHVAKSQVLVALGSLEAALAATSQATSLAPDLFGAWRARATALDAAGNADQARQARDRAMALIVS